MNIKEELSNLIDTFSNLSTEDQTNEIKEKIKVLIGILNQINEDKELLLISTNQDESLTSIFSLLCCLEDEIGKLLENKFKV